MALPRSAHHHAHPPPGRGKKRHPSRSQEHPADPAILALQEQAHNQAHNVSSSRDASEEDNDEDEDDSLDEDEDDDDDDDNAVDDDGGDVDEDAAAAAAASASASASAAVGAAEGKPPKLSKAERAARRAAARRHPSSDDADAVSALSGPAPVGAPGVGAQTTAGTLGAPGQAIGANVAAPDASTVSPSRRASTHAALRDRDHHNQILSTLAHASSALHQHTVVNSSSSASNADEDDGDRTSSSASQLGAAGDAQAPAILARRVQMGGASAATGSASQAAAPSSSLHLGTLPEVKTEDVANPSAMPTVTASGEGTLAATGSVSQTPRSGAGPHGTLAPPQKKASLKSGLGRNEDQDELSTDEAGGTPYDGDVEGPNPNPSKVTTTSPPSIGNIPHPQPIPFPIGSPVNTSSFNTSGPSGAYPHPHASNSASAGSAPDDTPLTLPTGGARPRTRVRSDASDKEHAILAAPKSPHEIRAYIRDCIWGERAKNRSYKINEPRDGGGTRERPIRIYADGVFDMFHYAHTLLLRQAKLFFPHVHLIAGVNSSTLCAEHKNRPLLSSEERYASVAACKWVDEVIVDAPWFITPDFIAVHKIDYVAHDDAPYANASSGSSDVYGWLKEAGLFLPTLRTEGVSTSELLGRVVEVYQSHALDDKLRKVGLEKLIDSRSPSGQTSPQHADDQAPK